MTQQETELFERAYTLLDDTVPIPADCGKLCKKKCCRGTRNDGMILFPGEELFLQGQRFLRISEQPFRGKTAKMAVCKGRCRREWRPLSCRIYPFVPLLTDGEIRVGPDPRAVYFCPLLARGAETYIDPAFLAAVKEAFTLLLTVPGMPGFLTEYNGMLAEYEAFTLGSI